MSTGRIIGTRWLPPVLLGLALAACTQVNEQPPPPAAPEPPPFRTIRRGGVKLRPGSQVTGSAAMAPAPARVAAAPDARAAAVPETLNGHPDGPRREVLQKAMDGAMPSFQPCLREASGSINVNIAFQAAPHGRAERVRVNGGGPTVDRCLTSAVAAMKLPPFSGDPVPVTFPLSVERTVTPAPGATGAAAAKAPPANQPPSVFIKP